MAHWGISRRSRVWLGLVLFISLVWGASTAQGSLISFELSIEYSGAWEPVGPTPWLTATFADTANPDEVTLTLSTPNLTDSEHVKDWGFNLNPDPAYDPTALAFSVPDKGGDAFDDPIITTGNNFWQADGDGLYDIRFQFAAGGDSDTQFGVGDSVVYIISGISGLEAESFNFLSFQSGGAGEYKTAAHVVSIGETSGWVATPEPATLGLLLIGSLGLLRKRKA